jgi:tetratricopeptide (TPR) repeat protein
MSQPVPLPTALLITYGRVCRQAGRYAEALAVFEQVLQLPGPVPLLGYLEKGVTCLLAKQYGEARRTFEAAEQAVTPLPAEPPQRLADLLYVRWGLALTLTLEGRYDEAHRHWWKLRTTYPDPAGLRHPGARCQLAECLLGYFRAAHEAWALLDASPAVHVPSLLLSVDTHLERMDAPPPGQSPERLASHRTEAWNAARAGFVQLQELLDRLLALPLDPTGTGPRQQREWRRQRAELGLLLLRAGRRLGEPLHSQLETDLLALYQTETTPLTRQTLRIWLGLYYGFRQEFARAVGYLEEAQQADFDNVDLRSSLAQCYHRQGQWREAQAQYEEVLSYRPGHVEARMGLGELCLDLVTTSDGPDAADRLQDAQGHLSECLRRQAHGEGSRELSNRERAALHYLRGYGRVKQWETNKLDAKPLEEALRDFEAAHQQYPLQPDYRRASEKVRQRLPRRQAQQWLAQVAPLGVMGLGVGIVLLALVGRLWGFPVPRPAPTQAYLTEVLTQVRATDSLRRVGVPDTVATRRYTLTAYPPDAPAGPHWQPIEAAEFALLLFGGALLFVAGASLPQLLKFRIAGVELEKEAARPEGLQTLGAVSLSRSSLGFNGRTPFSDLSGVRFGGVGGGNRPTPSGETVPALAAEGMAARAAAGASSDGTGSATAHAQIGR